MKKSIVFGTRRVQHVDTKTQSSTDKCNVPFASVNQMFGDSLSPSFLLLPSVQ